MKFSLAPVLIFEIASLWPLLLGAGFVVFLLGNALTFSATSNLGLADDTFERVFFDATSNLGTFLAALTLAAGEDANFDLLVDMLFLVALFLYLFNMILI